MLLANSLVCFPFDDHLCFNSIILVLFQVASQFRIILANMSNQFTGIFGHIVSSIEVIDRVANFGGEGGRPEKTAFVANCGIYKS